MDFEQIAYALAKQVDSIISVQTNYGEIELDDEMREDVKITLERILERRFAEMKE